MRGPGLSGRFQRAMNESIEADAAGKTTNDRYAARELSWSADCQDGLRENRRQIDVGRCNHRAEH